MFSPLSRTAPVPLRSLPCSCSPQRRPCATPSRRRAPEPRRKANLAALPSGLEKWAALSADDAPPPTKSSSYFEPPPLTSDPDYLSNLDDLCTRALRAMLKGDADALKPGSSWADDVSALGNYCVSARQPPHVDGARFAFFLLELAANRWPSEADDLVGVYKDASEKMHGLLEESGWRMALKVRARFLRLGACKVFLFFPPPPPPPPLPPPLPPLQLTIPFLSLRYTGREGGRHRRCGRLRRGAGGDRELRWRRCRRRGGEGGEPRRGVTFAPRRALSLTKRKRTRGLTSRSPSFFLSPLFPASIRVGHPFRFYQVRAQLCL